MLPSSYLLLALGSIKISLPRAITTSLPSTTGSVIVREAESYLGVVTTPCTITSAGAESPTVTEIAPSVEDSSTAVTTSEPTIPFT